MSPQASRALLVLMVLFTTGSFVVAQDVCSFVPGYYKPAQVRDCFREIPLNPDIKTATLEAVANLSLIYSYTDLLRNSGPPYHTNIDFLGGIKARNEQHFASDFDFHVSLAKLFIDLRDGHTFYLTPRGYRNFGIIRPFGLASFVATNGSQLLYVTPGVLNATEYRAACNCDIDLENYYGKVVTRIDGDSALQWAGDYADSLGIHKDAAIRFNTLMSRSSQFPQFSAALHSLNPDEQTFFFANETTGVTIPLVAYSLATVTNVSDIIAANTRSSAITGFRDSLLHDEMAVQELLSRPSHELASHRWSFHPRESKWRSLKAMPKSIFTASSEKSMWARYESHQLASRDHLRRVAASITPPVVTSRSLPTNLERVDTFSNKGNSSSGNIKNLIRFGGYYGVEYYMYKGVTVLKASSFDLPPNGDVFWSEIVASALGNVDNNGLGRDLILDLSGNPGGTTCLQYWLLSFLVQPWWGGSFDSSDVLYSPWDFRKSGITDNLVRLGVIDASDYVDIHTRKTPKPDSDWYNPGEFHSRGGATSSYIPKAFYGGCSPTIWRLPPANSTFDKILVITDGRCTSECSQFLSRLQAGDRVQVLSYGGYVTQQGMDTSSYAGGSWLDWNSWATETNEAVNRLLVPILPTTAVASVNFNEMYLTDDDSELPREFKSIPAQYHYYNWAPLDGTLESLADLYDQALPLLSYIPSGLPSRTEAGLSLTPLTLAVVVIIAIFVLVFILLLAFQIHKRITFNVQMY